MNNLLEAAVGAAIKGELLWKWSVREYRPEFYLVTYQTIINNVSYGGGVVLSNNVMSLLINPKCILTYIQHSVDETELLLRTSGVY